MTIYCKDCTELEEKKFHSNISIYCKKFNIYLRMVPMDNNIIKYPVKCLECIEKENY